MCQNFGWGMMGQKAELDVNTSGAQDQIGVCEFALFFHLILVVRVSYTFPDISIKQLHRRSIWVKMGMEV